MAVYLSKFSRLFRIIKQNGGWKASYLELFRIDDLKEEILVGQDKFGNKYFQNKMYFMGRSRWVKYSDIYGMDYDGSQVPAEWHRWLHYIGDEPPTVVAPLKKDWMQDHTENLTGTSSEYVPYCTTQPKIHSWQPPQSS